MHAERKPRADGERTREAIVREAVSLATLDGLEGLSIGNLAHALDMSKSGIYAHFGSKQDLQLATVDEAGRIFQSEVIEPALGAPAGLGQLVAVCDAFFDYLARRTFPGGCFFAGAVLEMGTRPGPVKEQIAAFQDAFTDLIRQFAVTALEQHELPDDENPDALTFELSGIILAANTNFVLRQDSGRARHGEADRPPPPPNHNRRPPRRIRRTTPRQHLNRPAAQDSRRPGQPPTTTSSSAVAPDDRSSTEWRRLDPDDGDYLTTRPSQPTIGRASRFGISALGFADTSAVPSRRLRTPEPIRRSACHYGHPTREPIARRSASWPPHFVDVRFRSSVPSSGLVNRRDTDVDRETPPPFGRWRSPRRPRAGGSGYVLTRGSVGGSANRAPEAVWRRSGAGLTRRAVRSRPRCSSAVRPAIWWLARRPNVRPAQLRLERACRRSRRRRRSRRSRSPPVAAGSPRRPPPGHPEVPPASPPREAHQGRCREAP